MTQTEAPPVEKLTVHYTINGEQRDAYIEPNRTLLEVVRDERRCGSSFLG